VNIILEMHSKLDIYILIPYDVIRFTCLLSGRKYFSCTWRKLIYNVWFILLYLFDVVLYHLYNFRF